MSVFLRDYLTVVWFGAAALAVGGILLGLAALVRPSSPNYDKGIAYESGVDPISRRDFWELIYDLAEGGTTILVTTHYMDEAEELADTVGIIDRGKLVAEGTPQELIEQMGADTIHVIGEGERDAFVENVRTLHFVQAVNTGRTVIQIGVDSSRKRLVEIISQARDSDFTIQDITVAKPSLGDVFLKYTGRRLRDTDRPQMQDRMSLMA